MVTLDDRSWLPGFECLLGIVSLFREEIYGISRFKRKLGFGGNFGFPILHIVSSYSEGVREPIRRDPPAFLCVASLLRQVQQHLNVC